MAVPAAFSLPIMAALYNLSESPVWLQRMGKMEKTKELMEKRMEDLMEQMQQQKESMQQQIDDLRSVLRSTQQVDNDILK